MNETERAEVSESLRRFGFGEQGISSMLAMQESIQAGERARKRAARKPVEQTPLW